MTVFKKLPNAIDKDPPAIKAIKSAPSLTDQVPVKKVRSKVNIDFTSAREGFL